MVYERRETIELNRVRALFEFAIHRNRKSLASKLLEVSGRKTIGLKKRAVVQECVT